MGLVFQGQIATGQEQLDTDIRDLEVMSGPDGDFLYVSTGPNGGLSVYELREGAAPTLVDETWFVGLGSGASTGALQDVTLGGTNQMIFGGQDGGAGGGELVGYDLQAGGRLGTMTRIQLPGGVGEPLAMTATTLTGGANAGQTVIYAVDEGTGRLGAYLDTGSGLVKQGGATPMVATGGSILMQTAGAGANQLLLIADSTSQGVASYRIAASNGALTRVDSLGAADGLGINTPTAMVTLSAYGGTWVILGAAGSNSLSVMQLNSDGTLTAADHLLDTRDTRFGGIRALDWVTVDGQVFVVAGGADDGLSLCTLLPDGRLILRQSLANETGFGLENVTSIEAVETAAGIDIFVASASSPGLSQFSWEMAVPGRVVEGAGALSGGNGDDLIVSSGGGSERLDGKAGDDIIVAGSGAAVLRGGSGDDIFVLQPVAATVRIEDFQPGADRLDLSLFAMLRSPGQLGVTSTASGARIVWGETVIVVDSATGQSLDEGDIWADGFGTPDRMLFDTPPPPPPDPDMVLEGTNARERLDGGDGNDTIRAEGGNDTLRGIDGDDLLYGGDGHDTLSPGAGDDTIWAGNGNDSVLGSTGDDIVHGDAGSDTLWGGDGDDLVTGGDGNDTLGGSLGRDTLRGGAGNEVIYGGEDNDQLHGDAGADKLWAGTGNDLLRGGDGDDTLGGNLGNDTLWGGNGDEIAYGYDGNDQLQGEAGQDKLWGGKGNDLIRGGDGNDTLGGSFGHDTLWGGNGNEVIYGGEGNDTLQGEAGADKLWAGTGNDLVRGGDGNDTLGGNLGNDTLWGGGGNEVIYGYDGADLLYGEAGDDQLWAGTGNDTVQGGTGNDRIGGDAGVDSLRGEDGDDLIYGGEGNDTVQGGAGRDTLRAGTGNDLITGGSGDDTLWGEAGADTFIFAPGDGGDRIGDFTPGEDLIRLDIAGLDYAGLEITASGTDVLIETGTGADALTLTLSGLAPWQLDADDFQFL